MRHGMTCRLRTVSDRMTGIAERVSGFLSCGLHIALELMRAVGEIRMGQRSERGKRDCDKRGKCAELLHNTGPDVVAGARSEADR